MALTQQTALYWAQRMLLENPIPVEAPPVEEVVKKLKALESSLEYKAGRSRYHLAALAKATAEVGTK